MHFPSDSLFYTVKDFPLQAQNRKRAMEIVKELLVECQTPLITTGVKGDPIDRVVEKDRRTRRPKIRPNMSFPTSWLKQTKVTDNKQTSSA
jgi:hypothetical protein